MGTAEIFVDSTARQVFPNAQKNRNLRGNKLANMFRLGHRIGSVPGSRIADLVSMRKTLLLCTSHRKKFNARAANYFYDKNLPDVVGTCEECGVRSPNARLLIHESYVATRSEMGIGSWYVPKQELDSIDRAMHARRRR